MTRKARQMVEWFEYYTARYRDAKGLLTPALELKYRHSQRVAENTRLIARGLKKEMIIRGGETSTPKSWKPL
ncbi:MAG: hypothetical protein GX874_04340 [Smithella sp.]|nr:hypothetical protein [Smithella sp.]